MSSALAKIIKGSEKLGIPRHLPLDEVGETEVEQRKHHLQPTPKISNDIFMVEEDRTRWEKKEETK